MKKTKFLITAAKERVLQKKHSGQGTLLTSATWDEGVLPPVQWNPTPSYQGKAPS
jgi:hypothetical protein